MLERYLLTRVLRETQGNQSKAARRLGITRGSLRNKMRELGIQVGQVVEWRSSSAWNATAHQGFSFQPSTKPMPNAHIATTSGRSRA